MVSDHAMTQMGWGWGRVKILATTVAALLVASATVTVAAPAVRAARVNVIVRAVTGSAGAAETAVQRSGGHVGRRIGILNGFQASVPEDAVSQLRDSRAIVSVTPDAHIHLLSVDPTLGYDPTGDTGSLNEVSKIVGAQALWQKGFTGASVDVALIDSGVSPVRGLDAPGKIVNGPDLSFDSPASNLRYYDTFGHGTHMAGIIAGRDPDAVAPYADPSKFVGIAPNARLVSVKVAAADGSTDVSQVIAGIDWVVQHKNDNGLNVRVLNLSFGTDSTQSYMLDPLAYAAEVAWRHGIVVVVSAGNGGSSATSLTDPAFDPYVLAVSADDPVGTESRDDDTVAAFASRGNATRHADVVAPGRSVISLRDPNSFIDSQYPSGRVGTRFFRGSGTSQAAAVTSGVVALLLDQKQNLTPDQVKSILMSTAYPLKNTDAIAQGSGLIDAVKARNAPTGQTVPQAYPPATGLGTLEGSRGSYHVADNGVALTGEKDIFGQSFNTATWAPLSAAGSTWSGGTYNGSTWSGSTWSGSTWSGSTWSGSTWSGSTWSSHTWSGSTWSGSTWSGSTWSGSTWSGSTWSGNAWPGSTWSASIWEE